MRKASVGLGIVILLTACGDNGKGSGSQGRTVSEVDQAYTNCTEQVATKLRSANPGASLPDTVVAELVSASCEIIKDVCTDPQSALCRKVVEAYL